MSPTYRILIGTFNANCRTIDQDLSTWLLTNSSSLNPSGPPLIPDIVAVGFQELTPLPEGFLGSDHSVLDSCRNLIDRALSRFSNSYNAEGFTLVACVGHTGRAIFMYARDVTIRGRVRNVETSYVGFGYTRLMGNKGAVGVWVRIQGRQDEEQDEEDVELCFVNAHLAAHDWNVKMRNRDFAALAERLVFVVEDNEADLARGQNPASISKGKKRQAPREDAAEPLLVNPDTSSDSKPRHRSLRTIYDSDYTFLFGDLNYRISLTAPGSAPITIPLLLGLITDALPDLRPYDQLTIERANQRTLQGFFEGPLSFPPTYKFVVGTEDEYQSTLRIPSWCDRILWWHRMPLPTPIGTGALEVIAYADSASAQHPGKPNADSTPLRRLSSLGPNPALHAQPLTLHTYTSHGSYRFSDHKPVSALFTVCPSALPPRAASARPPRSHDNVDMYWRVKRVVGTSMDHAAGYSWLVATTRVGRLVLLGMLALGGWAALELWASR